MHTWEGGMPQWLWATLAVYARGNYAGGGGEQMVAGTLAGAGTS